MSRKTGVLCSPRLENLPLGEEGLFRTLAQRLLREPLVSSAPPPPSAFDILPDSGHCWRGRGGAICGPEEEGAIGDLELPSTP